MRGATFLLGVLLLAFILGWCFHANAAVTNWPSASSAKAKVELSGTRLARAKELPAAASEKANGKADEKGKAAAEPPAREFPLMMVPRRLQTASGGLSSGEKKGDPKK